MKAIIKSIVHHVYYNVYDVPVGNWEVHYMSGRVRCYDGLSHSVLPVTAMKFLTTHYSTMAGIPKCRTYFYNMHNTLKG